RSRRKPPRRRLGPHRHLEDQTDHLLFFGHLSSPVAKHYSHASWSLRSPCGICCFAPNICSSLPELRAAVITRRARPARLRPGSATTLSAVNQKHPNPVLASS